MKISFNFKKLREEHDSLRLFILDIFMIILAFVYIGWTLLDLVIRTDVVKELVLSNAGEPWKSYYTRYDKIDTIFYDSIFIFIFLSELLIRWVIAIRKKTYHRWFFYPFVHWYDTLGCIPIASFKFFRIFRILSAAYRLHKLGVIDLKNSYLYLTINKYLNVITEEVSDRVVVNVLGGVQSELSSGTPVVARIINEVVKPQKGPLIDWLSQRIQQATSQAYITYHADIKDYVDTLIEDAVEQNREIGIIEKIPIVGGNISHMLESAIADIVFKVINQALQDLGSPKNKLILDDIAEVTFDVLLQEGDNEALNLIAKNIANQSIEIVKDQVKVQQWKLREQKA